MENEINNIHISRDWLYTKILDASAKKYHGKLCGIVLAGGSGAGKTTFCRQLSTEMHGSRKHTLIKNKLIASYLVPPARDKNSGGGVVQFLQSVYSQLCETTCLTRFREQEDSGWLREAVDDPDEVFKKVVLFPLLESQVKHKVVIFLVDGLNLELLNSADISPEVPSRSIPHLLSRHAHLFPRWLLPVFTTRQSTSITAHFPGFRRISIDDLRKTHVIQDIQEFIIARLQIDRSIAKQVTKESTELFSLLHVKSAGCFLYIKKVFDGISEKYIEMEEIRDIPGTLNGLYLWLTQKQFNRKNFPKVRPLVNILLASNTFTQAQLFQILSVSGGIESQEQFNKLLIQLRPLLSAEYRAASVRPGDGEDEPVSLYHYSLAEWFTQTKFCGPVYECKPEDGAGAIKRWKLEAEENIYDKPDLVLLPTKAEDEETEPMWMLLNTDERNQRKQERNKSDDGQNKNIEDCVREDDATSLLKLLKSPKQLTEDELLKSAKISEDGVLSSAKISEDVVSKSAKVTEEGGYAREELEQYALQAAREGSSDALRVLIELGNVDPDTRDENGWTLLRTASWAGKDNCVQVLVELRSDVNAVDGDLRTALRAACWAGHLECVDILLNSGADVNQMDSEGRTAMIAACYMGHVDCVRTLIIWGADIEIMDQDGRSALSVAVTCESDNAAKLVTLLVDNGANPNLVDKDGMSPLLIAAFEGKHQVCEILLENNSDMDHADKEGKTALFAAACMGHLEILNLLMFWGCYVDGIDNEGRTVLSVAAAEGSAPIVKVLLARGLDEQHRDNAGWGPLHYSAFEGHSDIVGQLIEAGAELNMIDSDGKAALHLACQENHFDVIVLLLRARANVNLVTLQGRTPLRIALLEGFLDIAGILMDNGADIDYIDTDSRTTLYMMALECDVKSVEFLLNHGANTELKDSDGRTPLHVAAWQGYTDIVQVLLLNGADVNSLDGGRRSALLSACWQGHHEVVDMLLTAGADVNQQCDQGASPLAVSAQEGHISVLQLVLNQGADPLIQDHHGRDAYRVALRNNNAIAAELLEKYMKRLSDSRAPENLSRLHLEDDPESPLYASPTAYGYAKIGAYSRRTTPARSESPAALASEHTPPIQESEFIFNQTGHMAIILGRTNPDKQPGLFENIKEKAKSGFSATKRNFL